MVTTLDEYRPYDAGSGANVLEAGWRSMMSPVMTDGAIAGLLDEFLVYGDSSGRQTKVMTGHCWIRGHQGASTSEKTLSHSTNASGNPRIDRVILRNDFVNNRIELDVLTGTAAASPAAPSLTQSSSVWEISLAQVAIANGYSTIAAADVSSERVLTGHNPKTWQTITEQLLTAAGTISFTSIPQTFRHLMIILAGRGNAAVAGGPVLLRLNGDTGNNYDVNYIGTSAGAPAGTGSDAQSSMSIQKQPGTSATAARSGVAELLFPDYRSTTFQKTVLAKNGYRDGGVGGDTFLTTGLWRSTAAITQIDAHFNAAGTGWLTGTIATLLGLR